MFYIIGAGRVGTGLSLLSDDVVLIQRKDSLEAKLKSFEPSEDLLIVATRNDELKSIIESCPQAIRSSMVFVQNGMLSPFLESNHKNYAARAILYFAVSKLGDKPVPGGDTLIEGPRADQLLNFFKRIKIPAKIINKKQMAKVEVEKLLWNSVMGLLGEYYQESVAKTLDLHFNEFNGLIKELIPVIRTDLNISFEESELIKSLNTYSKEVANYEARIKEWDWRNKWFFDAMKRQSIKCPLWEKLHRDLKKI